MVKKRGMIFISIFLLVFIINFISAGLVVTNNQFSFNKTIEVPKSFTFQITNNELFNFSNIEFEDNPYVSTTLFNLQPGETKNITVDIIAVNDFSGIVKVKGFYSANLGAQNLTHNVNIDYTNGFSICDFSIVQGDKITWNNSVNGAIKLINYDTGGEITTIQQNATYQEIFNSPLMLRTYATRYGIRFTDICQITVLDTQGLIQNPEYDANLILDIKMNYVPTNIEVTILKDNYTISPGVTSQDILNIKNNGTNIAKNILLSGDWFSTFTVNNFDLNPGESKNIGYSIHPIITNTTQTNKSYIKNLSITGNFNSYSKNFNIFIPYTEITGSYYDNTRTLEEIAKEYIDFIKAYCAENPNNKDCSNLIKKYSITNNLGNSSSEGISLEFIKAFIDYMDSSVAFRNIQKTQFDNFDIRLGQIESNVTKTSTDVASVSDKSDSYNVAVILLVIVIFIGLVSAGLVFGFRYYHRKHKGDELKIIR